MTPNDETKIRTIVCPGCKTVQKMGTNCGICRAPLYPPYLHKTNEGWELRTYKEIEGHKE